MLVAMYMLNRHQFMAIMISNFKFNIQGKSLIVPHVHQRHAMHTN